MIDASPHVLLNHTNDDHYIDMTQAATLTDLPPEILARILLFCAEPETVALSCTHSTLQVPCEYTLYRHLVIAPCSHSLFLRSLQMQPENWPADSHPHLRADAGPRRCSHVRLANLELDPKRPEAKYFGRQIRPYVHYDSVELVLPRFAGLYTSGAFVNLVDLRVVLGFTVTKEVSESVVKLLSVPKAGLQLQTLFCNHWLNLARILDAQPDLQNLGLYIGKGEDTKHLVPFLHTRSFKTSSGTLPPTVLTLHIDPAHAVGRRELPKIGLFPSLCTDPDYFVRARVLLRMNRAVELECHASHIRIVTVYCDTLESVDRAVAGALECCWMARVVQVRTKDPAQVAVDQIPAIVPVLKGSHVTAVNVGLWSEESLSCADRATRIAFAKAVQPVLSDVLTALQACSPYCFGLRTMDIKFGVEDGGDKEEQPLGWEDVRWFKAWTEGWIREET